MQCKICGKEFELRSSFSNQIYCSAECREVVRKEHLRQINEKNKAKTAARDRTKRCIVCGENFWANHNEKYCSESCRKKARRLYKYTTELAPQKRRKKVKEIKTLDDLMAKFKEDGKTPYDYHEWKVEQAKKRVTPINLNL